MTKEQIIEQINESMFHFDGVNEAIDDVAFYLAAKFQESDDKLFNEIYALALGAHSFQLNEEAMKRLTDKYIIRRK